MSTGQMTFSQYRTDFVAEFLMIICWAFIALRKSNDASDPNWIKLEHTVRYRSQIRIVKDDCDESVRWRRADDTWDWWWSTSRFLKRMKLFHIVPRTSKNLSHANYALLCNRIKCAETAVRHIDMWMKQ